MSKAWFGWDSLGQENNYSDPPPKVCKDCKHWQENLTPPIDINKGHCPWMTEVSGDSPSCEHFNE